MLFIIKMYSYIASFGKKGCKEIVFDYILLIYFVIRNILPVPSFF